MFITGDLSFKLKQHWFTESKFFRLYWNIVKRSTEKWYFFWRN